MCAKIGEKTERGYPETGCWEKRMLGEKGCCDAAHHFLRQFVQIRVLVLQRIQHQHPERLGQNNFQIFCIQFCVPSPRKVLAPGKTPRAGKIFHPLTPAKKKLGGGNEREGCKKILTYTFTKISRAMYFLLLFIWNRAAKRTVGTHKHNPKTPDDSHAHTIHRKTPNHETGQHRQKEK